MITTTVRTSTGEAFTADVDVALLQQLRRRRRTASLLQLTDDALRCILRVCDPRGRCLLSETCHALRLMEGEPIIQRLVLRSSRVLATSRTDPRLNNCYKDSELFHRLFAHPRFAHVRSLIIDIDQPIMHSRNGDDVDDWRRFMSCLLPSLQRLCIVAHCAVMPATTPLARILSAHQRCRNLLTIELTRIDLNLSHLQALGICRLHHLVIRRCRFGSCRNYVTHPPVCLRVCAAFYFHLCRSLQTFVFDVAGFGRLLNEFFWNPVRYERRVLGSLTPPLLTYLGLGTAFRELVRHPHEVHRLLSAYPALVHVECDVASRILLGEIVAEHFPHIRVVQIDR
jgi:hypothetical protein